MCIIIAKPVGVALPSDTVLEHCARVNRDGAGLAWTNRGMVTIRKDFADVEVLKLFLKEVVSPGDACLIHFRIATAGLSDEGNRHPFPLTRKAKRLRATRCDTDIAVAHNGTFSGLNEHKKYSDTLLFIKNILADPIVRNNLHTEAIQELISGYVDTSRLATLDRHGIIRQFGRFYTEDGLIFSNDNYKTRYSESYDSLKNKRACAICHKWKYESAMEKMGEFQMVCVTCVYDAKREGKELIPPREMDLGCGIGNIYRDMGGCE